MSGTLGAPDLPRGGPQPGYDRDLYTWVATPPGHLAYMPSVQTLKFSAKCSPGAHRRLSEVFSIIGVTGLHYLVDLVLASAGTVNRVRTRRTRVHPDTADTKPGVCAGGDI